MAETDAALRRTRSLISKQVGIELVERVGDAYRDPTGDLLEGDWLGAFAQPSLVFNRGSTMSVRLGEGSGQMVDAYGESTLELEPLEGRRVRMLKKYSLTRVQRFATWGRQDRASIRHFHYVGELRDGVLAGYWYSAQIPTFRGVFWLERVDRLSDQAAERLRSRMERERSRGRRAAIVMASVFCSQLLVPLALTTGGETFAKAVAFGLLGLYGVLLSTILVLSLRSALALNATAKAWMRAIG